MVFRPDDLGCDSKRLERLLRDALPADERGRAIAHLDHCEDCQQRIERLAAGTHWWRDARCLDDPVDGGSDAWGSSDELPPGFLDPPETDGQLGRLGPYTVLEIIGRGGMGVVLKAHDAALNRFVAIKVLAPHLAGTAVARRRFYREAKAAAAVSHEHVVAIHAVEPGRTLPWLVMQCVAGKSLQQRIDQTGPLDPIDILRIGKEAAAGLAAAHAQGLIHRDIKPSNILLENGVERVKLTDFGLALAVDDASATQSGLVAGTPQYMAPEQARGEAVDHRADLFSLGSVLYAMACGRPPFRAGSTIAVLRRVSDDPPRPVREVNPDVPEWLAAIIARLHAMDPANRFQSAVEVSDLLGRWLAHLHNPKAVPAPPEPVTRRPLADRRVLAAGALALVCLIVAGGASGAAQQAIERLATVLRINTASGTLVVEVDDPTVKVHIDGEDVLVTGAGLQEIRVRPGKHAVSAEKDGNPIHEEIVSVERGGRKTVRVSREAPAVNQQTSLPSPATPSPRVSAGVPPSPRPGQSERSELARTTAVPEVSRSVDQLVARVKQDPTFPPAIDKERFGLFAIDVDRGVVTQVAREPDPGFYYCGSPCWASDGDRIVFDASPGARFHQTRLKMISSRGQVDLGAGTCPSFSPDGQRVAFQLNTSAGPFEPAGIYTMRLDQSDRRRVADFGRPKWSPDGQRLMIVGFANPCPVTIADLHGGREPIAGLAVYPVPNWVRKDTIVAAVQRDDGDRVALFDISRPEQPAMKEVLWRQGDGLETTPGYPVYSATARRCVFVGADSRGMALYCVDQDKPGPPRRLEPGGFDVTIQDLALSPDGRYVLFCSDRPRRPPPPALRPNFDSRSDGPASPAHDD